MALDMYAADMHEAIGHHEEFIFTLFDENDHRFPVLSLILAELYDDPRLSPSQANALVHELLELLACNGGGSNRALSAIVLRLATFFSAAFRTNQEVHCSSD